MSNLNFIWNETFPCILFKGSGSKDFLHGQTTADIKNLANSQFARSCWLNAIGRVKALLEICIRPEGLAVLILAGDCNEVYEGFKKVIFPADKLEIVSFSTKRRLQNLYKGGFLSQDIMWLDQKEAFVNPWPKYDFLSQEQVDEISEYAESEECYEGYVSVTLRSICDGWEGLQE